MLWRLAIRLFGKPVVVVYICEFATFMYDCDVQQNTLMKPETCCITLFDEVGIL